MSVRQQELLIYINDYIARKGFSPSVDEMKDALDLKSKSAAHRLLMTLQRDGFIRRLPDRARAIQVVRMLNTDRTPQAILAHYCPSCGGQVFPASPNKPVCPRHGLFILSDWPELKAI